jgi:hypothetical protein
MKPFYGKEWFYDKLVEYINAKACATSRCLILLGDTGTGKSHLACELKWPTFNVHLASLKYLSKQIVNVYFFNRQLNRSRYCYKTNLEQFSLHLSRSLLLDTSFDLEFKSRDDENGLEYLNRICLQFVQQVLAPLKQRKCIKLLKRREACGVEDEDDDNDDDDDEDEEKNYFILVDGVEDEDENENREKNSKETLSSSQMILMFLNKTFIYFPHWLHLIFTSKRCVERK